jgi:2-hydroxycyclohexanecarboxyl-CoA dehydrogenase
MAMRADFDFSGGVVIITGGANGIGAALARRAAEAGATVVIADVQDEAGKALAAEDHAPGMIEFQHLDVSREADVKSAFDGVRARHGRIDGLVCAAIVQPIANVVDLRPEAWARVLNVNLNGVVWSAPYTTSKGAVAAFAKTLAREVAPHRVRVNLCRPGIIDTPQFRNSNPGADYSKLDRPEDPVGGLMFLLSDAAQMTGSMVSREMPWHSAA